MPRLWLVLLCALLGAWPAVSAAGTCSGDERRPPEATIHGADANFSHGLRAGSGPELLRAPVRVRTMELPGTQDAGRLLGPASRRPVGRGGDDRAVRDVVHARRVLGAQLLQFATPPPRDR